MTYTIVTNNSLIKSDIHEVIVCDGLFEDVLRKVRELVHIGYKLEVAPLPASHRMILSPVRTILLSKGENIDQESMFMIEKELEKYLLTMGERKPDLKNLKDYEIVDEDLLNSALGELGI